MTPEEARRRLLFYAEWYVEHKSQVFYEQVRPFQKCFLRNTQIDAVLDFTSIRGLYDGADPKTVAS